MLDSVLAGTAIRREAPPEIVLASTPPLILRLRLISSEPLDGQTISMLASQLGSRLGLPIQLHGQIGLEGTSYRLTLTTAKPSVGLTADDRAALRKVIQLVQKDNLRLQIIYPSSQTNSSDETIPHFVSGIRRVLSGSGLKSSQWTISAESRNEAGAVETGKSASAQIGTVEENPPASVPNPFRCELKAVQDF